MSRVRLALAAGFFLLVAACLLPCFSFLGMSGSSLPYQDPTPEMLEQQATDVAAAEQRFVMYAAVAGVLAVLAVVAFIYAWKHRPGAADRRPSPGER